MSPAICCLSLRPGLKRFREVFKGEGVEAFAFMDDVSLGLMGSRPTPLEPLPSFRAS